MDGPAKTLSQIGGYRLLEEIGHGGMGRVYRAERSDGLVVAVKIAREVIDEVASQQRFLNESLLHVDHPNIVKVLDVGNEEGRLYLVFNYLPGETLRSILDRGPMSSEEVVEMGLQLCDGLASAHAAGVIHRDIKPANVIRSSEGRYTLIDFGVALWNSDATRVTSHGQVVGTPAYLPPEQARGEIDIDGRTDVWSLGVLLYEAISGVSPFERGTPLATVLAVVMDQVPALGEVAPQASAQLQVAVGKAMKKSPSERWQDIHAFAEGLRQLPEQTPGAFDTPEPTLTEHERRLVVVLLAEKLFDVHKLRHAVTVKQGTFILLQNDRAVGIFGGTSSQGDELVRAAHVALDCQHTAERIAVASGHAMGRRSIVSGATLAHAQEAVSRNLAGVAVDPASARALAGVFEIQASQGGHVLVGVRGSSSSESLLIGRELELAQILREIERTAEEAEPRLAVIAGARGIGKTALLRGVDAGIAMSVDNAIVLRGKADPSEQFNDLSLITALVYEHLQDVHLAANTGPLDHDFLLHHVLKLGSEDGEQCADFLADLLGISTSEGIQIQAARSDPQLRRDQIFLAVRTYLSLLAERSSVLILIEDLHWADLSSVQFLSQTMNTSSGLPIALVVTVLPDEEEHCAELLNSSPHTRVELGPLSRLQVAKLAEATACQPLPEAVTHALAKRTQGNPLFVEHLVRVMYEGQDDITAPHQVALPPNVESAVQSRLDNLGPGIKAVCKSASVYSHAFTSLELEALGIADASEALDWLVRRGVLGVSKSSADALPCYSFRSSLVQDVAYGMLLPEQRQTAHLSAAAILSLRRSHAAEHIARHYELGRAANDAARWYLRATLNAAQRGDSRSVLRCSERAISLQPALADFDMYLARSDAYRFLGRREEQAHELTEALAAATLPLQKAKAETEYAWNLSRTGKSARALSMAERAVDSARDAMDKECLARALGWRAVALAQLGRLDDAVDALGEATRTARGVSASVEALATEWRAQVAGARGDLAGRLQAFLDVERQYNAVGDARRAAGAACNVADLYNRLGDYQHAERALRLAREACRRVNNRLVEGYATANLGYALMRQGRLEEANAEFEQALALANETNETVLKMVVRLYQSRAALGIRPPAEILFHVQQIEDEARITGLAPLQAMALSLGSAAALLANEVDRALSLALAGMEIRDRLGGLEEDEAELFVALADAQERSGKSQDAQGTRERGKQRLQSIAATISDPALRQSFLQTPANALLLD